MTTMTTLMMTSLRPLWRTHDGGVDVHEARERLHLAAFALQVRLQRDDGRAELLVLVVQQRELIRQPQLRIFLGQQPLLQHGHLR